MKYILSHKNDNGQIILQLGEKNFERYYSEKGNDGKLYSIVWNRGVAQTVRIDEVNFEFGSNCMLPIMMDQSFTFENPENIVAWQFNQNFYCIANHDAQVGCVGFVFYGPSPTMFLNLEAEQIEMMDRMLTVFEEEFLSEEEIKEEMLRMLLVRLIIQVTRIAKKQYLGTEDVIEEKFNLIRQYNLLVEIHYRKEHQVQFYAGLLNKSPKTISNYFSLYSKKTPLQVIQERIIAEAKRLFYYTDKSVKEIADDLGFDEVAHFSKFFKNCTSQNPSDLKKVTQNRK
ncbi:MAG: AraC family transcriptional regulator [Gloeobacteraceae cyanobacterium ES-bin-316]|nr:AraC family transcriptional regulator [Ferruginibacter sp.]